MDLSKSIVTVLISVYKTLIHSRIYVGLILKLLNVTIIKFLLILQLGYER